MEYLKEDLHYSIPPEDVSAVLFEPVMGEGGYVVPPERYIKALRRFCDDHGFLLIFDEVQTGLGRTGKLFASEVFEVVPDILLMGKAIGAGFPLAIVASTKERMAKWESGAHGSTYGGNPVACAASIAQLEIISNEEFLASVRKKGEAFRNRLKALQQKYPEIGDVRGVGLMNGIELVMEGKTPATDKAKAILKYFMEKKILVLPCGTYKNVIRFIPPLNIEESLLDWTAETLEGALKASRRG